MKPVHKKSFLHRVKKVLSSLVWLDVCAGGVCIRERKNQREILCVMHKNGGIMLPKGRVKNHETLEQAALREFSEQTGIYQVSLGSKIGTLRDRIRRKKITFFWIEHAKLQTPVHDEAVIWVEIGRAFSQMKHTSERQFIKKYIL